MTVVRIDLTRYRLVKKMKDERKMTFEQIGEELHMSRQRAWEIYHRACKRFGNTATIGNPRQNLRRA